MSSFSEQVSSGAHQVDSQLDSAKAASREVTDAVEGISANEVATITADATELGSSAQESATEEMAELDRLTDHARETDDATDRQAASTQEVASMVDEVQEISDETAADAAVAAEATGQQTTELVAVSTRVATLAERAEALEATLGSTSSLKSIESGAEFAVGAGQFPVLDDRTGVLVGGASLWVGENPQFETAFTQLVESRDTTATRGAQIGPFDTVRSIIEDRVESMDAVEEVPAELDRLDEQVAATRDSSGSGR